MAWLFVPGLVDSTWPSGSSSPTIAPSVTSRGKPMPPARWWRAWRTVPWIRRLSGTMCAPFEADAGVDRWISSQPAFRARRGVPPAPAAASRTSAGSGLLSSSVFAKYDPHSSSWKMCLPLFPEADWPSFLAIWPSAGSMRSGICSPPPMSAPRISANACSSWPSATVGDSRSSARHTTTTGVMHPGTTLIDATRQWASPNVGDASCGNDATANREGSPSLTGQIWPTPAACDYKGSNGTAHLTAGTGPKHLDQLPNYVTHRWATPRAEDSECCGNHPHATDSLTGQTRLWNTPPSANTPSLERLSQSFLPLLATLRDGDASLPSPPSSLPRSRLTLNPQFVCWLMNLPIGWTGLSPLASTSYAHWATQSSRCVQQWRSTYSPSEHDC